MSVRPRRAEFAVLLVLLVADPAQAGPWRLMGADAAAFASGNSHGAIGYGLGVVLSNPALLTDLPDQFGVHVTVHVPGLQADLLPRPVATEVPITYYDSDVGIQGSGLDRPLPTAELRTARHDQRLDESTAYIGLGFAHSLGFEGFKLGLLAHVPATGLASLATAYPEEREQYFGNTVHFARFGEWGRILVSGAGIAYAPWEFLSVGVAAEVTLASTVVADMYVPEATVQDYALVNSEIDATPVVRAVVGLKGRPVDWLHLGLTFRDRKMIEADIDAKLDLWNYHESTEDATVLKQIRQQHHLAIDYEPLEVAAAVGVTFAPAWAQVTVTWSKWDNYFDQHRQHPEDAAAFPATNPGDRDTEAGSYTDDFRFHDTATVRVGAGYTYLEGFELLAGFGYYPTPVPAQVGRTSYVDSDLFVGCLGHRFQFAILDNRFVADIGVQFWTLVETTVHKDPTQIRDEFADRAKALTTGKAMAEAEGLQTNNPGFPGYEAGGWLFAAAATLTYLF